jgi:hypothetical protein
VKWTKDINAGHPINEDMGFNSKEGMEIFVGDSLSYAIDPWKAPVCYVKYRADDLEAVQTRNLARQRAQVAERSGVHLGEDSYGQGKAAFSARSRGNDSVESYAGGRGAIRLHEGRLVYHS